VTHRNAPVRSSIVEWKLLAAETARERVKELARRRRKDRA
jgi:hypothetical protein